MSDIEEFHRMFIKGRFTLAPSMRTPCLRGGLTGTPAQLNVAESCLLAKLDRLTLILQEAKNKLESGLDLSVEEVRILNEALDDLAP